MATNVHVRDLILQADSPRVENVTLPSNVSYNGDTSGDHLGTLGGSAQTNFQNSQITLSSTGALQNAGGGALTSLNSVGGNYLGSLNGLGLTVHRNDQISLSSSGALLNAGGGAITALNYNNVSGTKPPSNATANFFSTSGSNPSGGSDGDAHWNSSSSTMWFKTGGTWRVGGTINANEIITGTLAAARIASNSITADKIASNSVTSDKINVGTLSGISSNAGTITAGTIQSSAAIDINGIARFNGNIGGYSILANNNHNGNGGISTKSASGSLPALRAENVSGGGYSIDAISNSGGTTALRALNQTGGTALRVDGPISITTQTISNLTVGTAGSAGNATNANDLGGVSNTNWCRLIATESGTANASGFGFQMHATVTNINTIGSGNIVEIRDVSDRKTKTEIEPETLDLEFIKLLKPVTFKSNGKGDLIRHGFVADDIGDLGILPENDSLYHVYPDDGLKGTDYICIISPLVKAVQQLSDKLDQAQRDIRMMRFEINKLKGI